MVQVRQQGRVQVRQQQAVPRAIVNGEALDMQQIKNRINALKRRKRNGNLGPPGRRRLQNLKQAKRSLKNVGEEDDDVW